MYYYHNNKNVCLVFIEFGMLDDRNPEILDIHLI